MPAVGAVTLLSRICLTGKLLSFIAVIAVAKVAFAESTAFTHQGVLTKNGSPANGPYDMQFKLFDSAGGGTQIGNTITWPGVGVSDGAYSVILDFGAAAFPGADRFLEMSVSEPNANNYVVQTPRVQMTAIPYSITAITASSLAVPSSISGSSAVAVLSLTNSAPGILNASYPANVPPAVLSAEATSTTNENVGLLGIADGPGGVGVYGIAPNSPNGSQQGNKKTVGVFGTAFGTTGDTVGVEGDNNSSSGVAVKAQCNNGGFLFDGTTPAGGDVFNVDSSGNVQAQGRLSTGQDIDAGGSLGCSGDLNVGGAKHALVHLPDGKAVLLSAMESPENWFEDFGSEKLHGGAAWVPIDKTFAQTSNVEMDYHVFLTPGGDCKGLYVAKKTPVGFEVREMGDGHSEVQFDYRVVSRRRGFEAARFETPAPRTERSAASAPNKKLPTEVEKLSSD